MDIRNQFGANVSKLRRAKGLSQEKLARVADIDRSYVSKIELGKTTVSIVVAQKISIALGAKMSDFFT
ncbi:MAG: helix-turn-helix transcriptional regulator [Crocinitomicaceae bacterium]|nr:helix-turn-helix transcriptional regulator [Crocinitomicaceae bacterium]